MDFSVAICAYNAQRTISAVIDAALAQSPSAGETIVVDDGSTDDTARIVNQFHDVKLIKLPENRGVAFARNRALDESKHEIVVFLDADAVPRGNCFRNLLVCFDDQNVAAVGGRAEEFFRNDFVNHFRALYTPQSLGDRPIFDAPMFMGLCFAIRRGIAKSVSGFDEIFKTNGEDADISFRIKKAGYRIYYEPDAVVDHLKFDNFFSMLSQAYRFGLWAMVASKKNGLSADWFIKPATKNLIGNGIDRLKKFKFKEASMFFALYSARLLGIFIGLFKRSN